MNKSRQRVKGIDSDGLDAVQHVLHFSNLRDSLEIARNSRHIKQITGSPNDALYAATVFEDTVRRSKSFESELTMLDE